MLIDSNRDPIRLYSPALSPLTDDPRGKSAAPYSASIGASLTQTL